MKTSLLFVILFYGFGVYAQKDSIQPPYKQFPTVPTFQILLSDSSTMNTKSQLSKKSPVLFMIFNPDCTHCQHETEIIFEHRDDLKKVQIIMVTLRPLPMVKDFVLKYKLNELPNVVVGRDITSFTPSFFKFQGLPFLAVYNEKGNLINSFESSLGIAGVLQLFKQTK